MLFDSRLNAQIVCIGVVIRTVVRKEQCVDISVAIETVLLFKACLLYTSDAADDSITV